MQPRKLVYHPDIDGLRAIAVLAVVLFHAFPTAISGGFVGVDVFFVISGFLISSIIFDDLEDGRFSFLRFYTRRVLRIFPALIVVLSFSLAMGWLFLSSYLFKNLARETLAGSLFGANFLFWRDTGYFDPEAASKPLLHLWSLGIEEQFYLIWPAALYACYRLRWNATAVIAATATASFAFNWHQNQISPDEAFFLPQNRFWELMIGALLACPSLRSKSEQISSRTASYLSLLGVSAIVAASVCANLIPAGERLVLPTLGAAAVVHSVGRGWLNTTVLSAPASVFVGKISYPLYLWHWPLLYFYRLTPESTVRTSIVIGLSFVLAFLTFLAVEKPLLATKKRTGLSVLAASGTAAILAIVTFFSYNVLRYNGFLERQIVDLLPLDPRQTSIRDQIMRVYEVRYDDAFAAFYGEKPCFRFKQTQTASLFVENGCLAKQFRDRPDVFLLGDSHAAALSIGLLPLLTSQKINFQRVTYGWCEPTSNRKDKTCDDINAKAFNWIHDAKPELLILDAHWFSASRGDNYQGDDYFDQLPNFLARLKSLGARHILVVGQMPTYDHSLPERLIEDYVRKGLPVPARVRSAEATSIQTDELMQRLPYPSDVEYVSLRDHLCNAEGCLAIIGPDLTTDILLWDYGHLMPKASDYVAREILWPVIATNLERRAAQAAPRSSPVSDTELH